MERKYMAPIMFATVAFFYCAFNLLSVCLGWNFPVRDSENHFANMLILSFCAVVMTAYPYQLLQSSKCDVWTYVREKSAVFGMCSVPFLLLMIYIYQTYGEGKPLMVSNIWDFCVAYVMSCWGFMLFLLVAAYDIKNWQK